MIHTAEGARTARELGNYFSNPAAQVSSHVGIDDTGIEQYVDYSESAWTVLAGNPVSENAELCGFAAWSRDEWLTQHHRMLELTAQWVRERCTARGIPMVKLSPALVGAGHSGVIGHIDWTLGMHDGTHTDPGPAFPWDVLMELAAGSAGSGAVPTFPDTEEDDMSGALLRYAKGDVLPNIYLVRYSMGDDGPAVSRRSVDGTEWSIVSQTGTKVAVLPQKQFDAIPILK